MLLAIGLLSAGLVLLTLGASWLVRGASAIAVRLGISPLVVGLTVVAFGTSAPELAVSLRGVLSGQTDIGIGNVIGSNIFNVLVILGLSSLVAPLIVHQKLVQVDVPIMIGASVALWLAALGGAIGRVEAGLLLLGFLAYTGMAIRTARRESAAVREEYAHKYAAGDRRGGRIWVSVLLVVLGVGLCTLGAGWLVDGATTIALDLGVSELVIGLTIVAAGTSLPELATSLIAALRGERDIAVGNIVGSNLFNILAILGLCGVIAPEPLPVAPQALALDLPVLLGAAVCCLPIFFTGHRIGRLEGALLLVCYGAYALALWALGPGGPPEALRQMSPWLMTGLAVAGLGGSLAYALWSRRNQP